MGQVQSQAAGEKDTSEATPSSSSTAPPPAATNQDSSLDSLIEEAAAFGEEHENLSLEEKAKRALECPCIADLRSGACGSQFSDAFLCFLKSAAPEKGSDCVHPFVMLQNCIKTNPAAFSKDILSNDDTEKEDTDFTAKKGDTEGKEKPSLETKVRPPFWSVESRTKQKHKSKA